MNTLAPRTSEGPYIMPSDAMYPLDNEKNNMTSTAKMSLWKVPPQYAQPMKRGMNTMRARLAICSAAQHARDESLTYAIEKRDTINKANVLLAQAWEGANVEQDVCECVRACACMCVCVCVCGLVVGSVLVASGGRQAHTPRASWARTASRSQVRSVQPCRIC